MVKCPSRIMRRKKPVKRLFVAISFLISGLAFAGQLLCPTVTLNPSTGKLATVPANWNLASPTASSPDNVQTIFFRNNLTLASGVICFYQLSDKPVQVIERNLGGESSVTEGPWSTITPPLQGIFELGCGQLGQPQNHVCYVNS